MGQRDLDIARDRAQAWNLWQSGTLTLDVAGRRIEPCEEVYIAGRRIEPHEGLSAPCPHCGATIPPIEPGFRVMAQAYRRCTEKQYSNLPLIEWGGPFHGVPAIRELYHCRQCGEPIGYLFQMRLPPAEV